MATLAMDFVAEARAGQQGLPIRSGALRRQCIVLIRRRGVGVHAGVADGWKNRIGRPARWHIPDRTGHLAGLRARRCGGIGVLRIHDVFLDEA